MVHVENGYVTGNITSGDYAAYKPWQHACGEYYWTCSDGDGDYEIGALTGLTQRTEPQIEATQAWIDWNEVQEMLQDQANAKTAWDSMPNWLKTFTEADAIQYVDDNFLIVDLPTFKQFAKHAARGLIALRDLSGIRIPD